MSITCHNYSPANCQVTCIEQVTPTFSHFHLFMIMSSDDNEDNGPTCAHFGRYSLHGHCLERPSWVYNFMETIWLPWTLLGSICPFSRIAPSLVIKIIHICYIWSWQLCNCHGIKRLAGPGYLSKTFRVEDLSAYILEAVMSRMHSWWCAQLGVQNLNTFCSVPACTRLLYKTYAIWHTNGVVISGVTSLPFERGN